MALYRGSIFVDLFQRSGYLETAEDGEPQMRLAAAPSCQSIPRQLQGKRGLWYRFRV